MNDVHPYIPQRFGVPRPAAAPESVLAGHHCFTRKIAGVYQWKLKQALPEEFEGKYVRVRRMACGICGFWKVRVTLVAWNPAYRRVIDAT